MVHRILGRLTRLVFVLGFALIIYLPVRRILALTGVHHPAMTVSITAFIGTLLGLGAMMLRDWLWLNDRAWNPNTPVLVLNIALVMSLAALAAGTLVAATESLAWYWFLTLAVLMTGIALTKNLRKILQVRAETRLVSKVLHLVRHNYHWTARLTRSGQFQTISSTRTKQVFFPMEDDLQTWGLGELRGDGSLIHLGQITYKLATTQPSVIKGLADELSGIWQVELASVPQPS
jgi:hypothetical protein